MQPTTTIFPAAISTMKAWNPALGPPVLVRKPNTDIKLPPEKKNLEQLVARPPHASETWLAIETWRPGAAERGICCRCFLP